MANPSLRVNIVRILSIIALISFSTGLLKFFGVRSRPLSMVHHYGGLVFIAAALSHIFLNRKALLRSFKKNVQLSKDSTSQK